MKSSILLLFLMITLPICGQNDWHDALREWMNTEDMESPYSEETLELLEEKAASPINLNQVTPEALEELPFLTAQQVEDIIAYVDRYQPVRSLNELFMIPSLDWYTRRLLCHFVYVGETKPQRPWPQMSDVAAYGKHIFSGAAKIPFYERKGDRNGYLGYRYRHDVRYQFNYNNRIKLGITGAQDAGEPFFSNKNRWGYDHYNYYLQLRDMGRLEEFNIGMYKVQLGMGLLMNTGFQLGKTASLQSQGRSMHLLTAHSSRSSSNYLHGIAATVKISRRWKATAFFSYRPLDATLNDDGTARTLTTSGYHRTPTEMNKKDNTRETDLGASIGYHYGTFHLHVNTVYTHLNRELRPPTALYQRYAAAGHHFLNTSVDYRYIWHHWTVQGEVAISRHGAMASLNSVSWRTTPTLTFLLLHRYYDKRYTALHANSFSEGGHSQNEHGVYLGANWKATQHLTLQAYADYAHFPWARYLVSAASDAFDTQFSARYAKGDWTFDGRYRLHVRQRDNDKKTALVNRYEHRLRLAAACQLTPRLTLRTQGDGVCFRTSGTSSLGGMVSQHATWKGKHLQLDAHLGWFHTDNYDSRIYAYEPSIPYDFSFQMYYGHGIRYALMAKYSIGNALSLIVKGCVTNYFDRSTVGTGLQQVSRSSLPEALLMLRYTLFKD